MATCHPLFFLKKLVILVIAGKIGQNNRSDQFHAFSTSLSACCRLAVTLPATLLLVGCGRVQEAREHGGELHGKDELGGRAGSQRFEGFEVLKTHGLGIYRVSHGVDPFQRGAKSLRS